MIERPPCHAPRCTVKTATARRRGGWRACRGRGFLSRSAADAGAHSRDAPARPGGEPSPPSPLRERAERRVPDAPVCPGADAVFGKGNAPGFSESPGDHPAFRTQWASGLLRETPGERALLFDHRSRGLSAPWLPSLRGDSRSAAPWRKAMRRENATWAVRAGVVVLSGGDPRATGPRLNPPDDTPRRPPHPAPQTVTIASRLSQ
jgi:hypothetical protein